MYFRLIVTLMVGFFISSGTSAEIFEKVHDYDVDAWDIKAGDFNNDGLDDFIVMDFWTSDSSHYEVFLSNGDCSFTRLGAVLVDEGNIRQLLIGDFIEDGNADLLIMNSDRDTWLYTGDGDGYFSEAVTYSWAVHNGCAADLNNDGHLDVTGIPMDYWVEPYGDTVLVMLGDGAGGFTESWVYDGWLYGYIFCSCQFAYLGDPDTDTILDMCVPRFIGFLVFQGVGDGTFSDPEYYVVNYGFGSVSQQYCTFGDFDEDGYNDIVISGDASMDPPSTYIFLNQQDGTFVQEPYDDGYFGADPKQIATADLDLDGHLDLSVAGNGSISGYGDGTFNGEWSEYLSYHPSWCKFVFMDMDLDGDLDLADWWGRIFRNTTITQGCEEGTSDPFTGLRLSAAPNPFSSLVNIEVSGYPNFAGSLQIFDLSGRLVNELEPVTGDGEAVFMWDGITSGGSDLPSGIYTASLNTGINTTSVTLLKLSN